MVILLFVGLAGFWKTFAVATPPFNAGLFRDLARVENGGLLVVLTRTAHPGAFMAGRKLKLPIVGGVIGPTATRQEQHSFYVSIRWACKNDTHTKTFQKGT